MNPKYLKYLQSPFCNERILTLDNDLLLDELGNTFSIINEIPRFVKGVNYSDSFGFQWNKFNSTQLDKNTGFTISKDRFFRNTRWNIDELKSKKFLEVGSGAGRFTEVLLETEVDLFTVDYSNAVDSNWLSNKNKGEFFIAQANLYELPFKKGIFDFVFCYGVIQHTPNVKKAFMCLVEQIKPGGKISIDVYKKNWKSIFLSKYWFRSITKRLNQELLLKFINWYVPIWFPISSLLIKIPFFGKFLCQIIPVCNYSLQFPYLNYNQLLEWAILDTFDMLSPKYDNPQKLNTLISWAKEANLIVTYCGLGDNGYVLNATKICAE